MPPVLARTPNPGRPGRPGPAGPSGRTRCQYRRRSSSHHPPLCGRADGVAVDGMAGDSLGRRESKRSTWESSLAACHVIQKAAPIRAMMTGARMVIAHPALRSEVSVRAWNFSRFVLIAPSFSTTSVRNPPISVAISARRLPRSRPEVPHRRVQAVEPGGHPVVRLPQVADIFGQQFRRRGSRHRFDPERQDPGAAGRFSVDVRDALSRPLYPLGRLTPMATARAGPVPTRNPQPSTGECDPAAGAARPGRGGRPRPGPDDPDPTDRAGRGRIGRAGVPVPAGVPTEPARRGGGGSDGWKNK